MTSSRPTLVAHGVLLRAARADDALHLDRLARLDSRTPLRGDVLVAEEDGVLRAALSLDGGRAVADPFARTEHLVALLREHAALRRTPAPAMHGRRLLPRLAFRAG
jgi:hypothetical protein